MGAGNDVDGDQLSHLGGGRGARVGGGFDGAYIAADHDGDKAAAQEALKAAEAELTKATSKGVYHKNTTSRKISRMTIMVNKMA